MVITCGEEVGRHAGWMGNTLDHDLFRRLSTDDRILDMRHNSGLCIWHEGMVDCLDGYSCWLDVRFRCLEDGLEEVCEQTYGEE